MINDAVCPHCKVKLASVDWLLQEGNGVIVFYCAHCKNYIGAQLRQEALDQTRDTGIEWTK